MSIVVVGIDVGGRKKGFHAVALKEGEFFCKQASTNANALADWCRSIRAQVVAVDAPCRWRTLDGRARLAELAMATEGIRCYYAPTEEKARSHAFYAWMLSGQELYSALAIAGCAVIETFPHAVTCALSGKVVSAKDKRSIRRSLLRKLGFHIAELSNIDEVDAALCAFAAQSFAHEQFKTYGDPIGGFIIVPNLSLSHGD